MTLALIESAAGALVVLATLLVRRRAAGSPPPRAFWAACLIGVIAVTVGTTMRVSGVLLTVPVVAVAAFAVLRGGWLLGDPGLFVTVLGTGMAWAYILAAVFDPDTGSFADQGALLLFGVGAVICVVAISVSLLRARKRGRKQG